MKALSGIYKIGFSVLALALGLGASAHAQVDAVDPLLTAFQDQFEKIGSGRILSRAEVIAQSGFEILIGNEQTAWVAYQAMLTNTSMAPEQAAVARKGVVQLLQENSDEIYDRSRFLDDYGRRANVMGDEVTVGSALGQLTATEAAALRLEISQFGNAVTKAGADSILSGSERLSLEERAKQVSQDIVDKRSNSDGVVMKEDKLNEDLQLRQRETAQHTVGCAVRKTQTLAQLQPLMDRHSA